MSICALIDIGIGNLHSARKAFARMAPPGVEVTVARDPDAVRAADRLVLPGDGAFPAVRRAIPAEMEGAIRESVEQRARPFLGICVGMQLLARVGHEYGATPGFGWIDGEVERIVPSDPALKVPHMGWNDLHIDRAHPVLAGIATGDHAYFVHSWGMRVDRTAQRLAWADHGGPVTAIVAEGCVVGTQFHPEKSQATGLRLIENFLGWAP